MAAHLVPRLGLSGVSHDQPRIETVCDLAHEFLESLLDPRFMEQLVATRFLKEEFLPFPQVDLLSPFIPTLSSALNPATAVPGDNVAPVASGSGTIADNSPPHGPPRKRSWQDLSDPIAPQLMSRESSGRGDLLVPSSSQASGRLTRSTSRGSGLPGSSSRGRKTRK